MICTNESNGKPNPQDKTPWNVAVEIAKKKKITVINSRTNLNIYSYHNLLVELRTVALEIELIHIDRHCNIRNIIQIDIILIFSIKIDNPIDVLEEAMCISLEGNKLCRGGHNCPVLINRRSAEEVRDHARFSVGRNGYRCRSSSQIIRDGEGDVGCGVSGGEFGGRCCIDGSGKDGSAERDGKLHVG